MANQRPPEPPPTPKGRGPMGSDGKPVKSGPNWRVIIFLLIGVGVLFMAMNSSTANDKAKEIGVAEFVRLLEADKILIDPLEGLDESKYGDKQAVAKYLNELKLKPDRRRY